MVHSQLNKWLTTALCVLLTAASSAALNYGDTINCRDSNGGMNVTETEAHRQGQCITYTGTNPCDVFYIVNEDRIFLPFGRAQNSTIELNLFAAQAQFVLDSIPQPCRDVALRLVCYYYYPPCGNSTHFLPPNSPCMDTCSYISETVCPDQWIRVLEFLKLPGVSDNVVWLNLFFLNCTNPGAALNQLPHCCSDAGIEIIQVNTTTTQTLTTSQSVSDPQGPNLTAIIPSSVVAIPVLLVITLIVTIVCVKRSTATKVILQVSGDNIDLGDQPTTTSSLNGGSTLPPLSITTDHGTPPATPTPRYTANTPGSPGNQSLSPTTPGMQPHRARVASTYIRQMDNEKLVIPGRHISLLDCIGRGEFGVVYRGHLTGWEGRTTPELVAVKTLKSMFSMKEIEDIVEESLKMKSFNNPNVLNLIGVCIDAGEAPYIVMPYMATGSLLNYLRKERPNLTIAWEASEDIAIVAKKTLLSICLQIAKGMEYLTSKKFVHRDLAARNCMIDSGFVIKVADFGLSEDIYAKNYFKQDKLKDDSDVKLPIRWMAIESLADGIFTEKTDVWSYGVTCWEVFSLGRTPYPAVDPFTLIKYLEGGGRLNKPSNAACSDDVYDFMMRCWNHVPDERPSFGDLVVSLNTLLEGVAGYLDFSALSQANGGQAGGEEGYDHHPKRDIDDGRYDHSMENMDGQSSPSISPD